MELFYHSCKMIITIPMSVYDSDIIDFFNIIQIQNTG